MQLNLRWNTAGVYRFVENDNFFNRNNGLVCRELREAGYPDVRFIALGDREHEDEERGLLLTTRNHLGRPDWWRSRNIDAVLISTWINVENKAILDALREAGVKSAAILDSDGVIGGWPMFRHIYRNIQYRVTERTSLAYPWSAPYAVLRTMARLMTQKRWLERAYRYLLSADLCLIESPMARRRLLSCFPKRRAGHLESRIRVLPRLISRKAGYDGETKANTIVSVGRLDSYAKNAKALCRAAETALERHPDWKFLLIGRGTDKLKSYFRNAGVLNRVRLLPWMENDEVLAELRSCKIFLLASRCESYCIAASEALSSGCSYVGSAQLSASSFYLSGPSSGTVAGSHGARDLADALNVEIDAWTAGQRDPRAISRYFTSNNKVLPGIRKLEEWLEQLPETACE